ncbi:MAG TPA: squalene/phytoene synthase family protein [Ktedonobacterales bacterium]|nr:squalene/phytoene synthase family protein [Ktedonobacterales bacterium]
MHGDVTSPNHVRTAQRVRTRERASFDSLAARITRAASRQTYYTARFLADRDRTLDFYRAYAYFRWADDQLDLHESERVQQLSFVARQSKLVDRVYQGERLGGLTDEEQLLVDLIHHDDEDNSGLQSYIRNMMAVLEFDANRRGRLITEAELAAYTLHVSKAVTDALHYFIGHANATPASESRYLPAMAAHITHLLRDTFEDVEAGYFNVPRELLESNGITPSDVDSATYREWVRSRVERARAYFRAGARYLHQVKSLRCRIAGFAYTARFTGILDAIEREGYQLRPAYPDVTGIRYGLRMAGSVGIHALRRGSV